MNDMSSTDIRLMKKKYRTNYLARFAWSVLMLLIVSYRFEGMIVYLTLGHIFLSCVWIALVELESPLIFIDDLRYFRITLDAFLYTLAIYITGGISSFCMLSYIIFVMLASLYATARYGIFAIVICVVFYNTMLLLVHSGHLQPVNILSDAGEGSVRITRGAVAFTNFFLVLVSVIMHVAAHTLYRNLMERTSELKTERNRLRERNLIIENDIRLARRIQEQLIPRESAYQFIHALYRPMEEVGGDFYDFIAFRDPDRIGIFLSDVSGHGVPAAFITSMIKTIILQAGSRREDPAEMLTYLNGLLYGKTAENFITAFYGIYHREERSLLYSNAGHNAPYLLAAHGIAPMNEARSIPLAIADDGFFNGSGKKYRNHQRVLEAGDRVLFYTDGLTEEKGPGREYESFEDYMLSEVLPFQRKESPRGIVETLASRLEEWSGSARFKDDVCIICLEVC